MGGIVEEFVPGEVKRSPSAQFRIDPLGGINAVSTHDQVLGGANGQVFLGCRFPAHEAYRLEIQARSAKVAQILAQKGVLGRFGVDFISVKDSEGWGGRTRTSEWRNQKPPFSNGISDAVLKSRAIHSACFQAPPASKGL
jgi:hypothetical protein